MVKELGKQFSIIQIVLSEYHALGKLKDFLYAELCTYHIECAILKQAFSKYTANAGNPDFNALRQVVRV